MILIITKILFSILVYDYNINNIPSSSMEVIGKITAIMIVIIISIHCLSQIFDLIIRILDCGKAKALLISNSKLT